ncbi:MAG: PAS domain-containing protein [Candidatus Edwardsbacteria bacterium]|nr:PAS domain-containing protein [Candidatus Edwardsbacteria bacterium]
MSNDRKPPATRRPTTRPPAGRAAAPSRPSTPSPTAAADISHLRAIVELAEDAVYIKDARLRYLFVNPAAVKYLGVPAAKLIGRTDAQVFGPATSRETDAADRRVLRRREAVTYERRGRSAGGERVFLTTKVPYRSPQGTLLGLIGISREITGRKLAEEELARSEATHRLLLNSIQSPVLALDERLRVVYCNKTYAEFVGRPPAGIEGQDLLRVFPQLRRSKTYRSYRQVLAESRARWATGTSRPGCAARPAACWPSPRTSPPSAGQRRNWNGPAPSWRPRCSAAPGRWPAPIRSCRRRPVTGGGSSRPCATARPSTAPSWRTRRTSSPSSTRTAWSHTPTRR